MNRVCLFLLSMFLASPLAALAQHATDAPASMPAVAPEAGQFDFLLGQWQLDVHPKVSGLVAMIHGTPKLLGTWKAWRTSGGGIEDEIRVVDGSGNPLSLNRSLRTWDAAQGHWKISGRDAHTGHTSEVIGRLQGNEMHLEGQFTETDGKTLTRTRYYDIGADSFRMQQDCSEDNGQSWEEGSLTIDAKRTAATATP